MLIVAWRAFIFRTNDISISIRYRSVMFLIVIPGRVANRGSRVSEVSINLSTQDYSARLMLFAIHVSNVLPPFLEQ